MESPLTCSTDCQHETSGKPTTTPATTLAKSAAGMADVQGASDDRMVAIDRVGVKEVVYPMRLATRDGGEQTAVATINMYVSLPQEKKGTHMSRFLEVLNEHQCSPFSPEDIPKITKAIQERLNAREAHFEASFTYFIEKPAPVSGQKGLMNYEVSFA